MKDEQLAAEVKASVKAIAKIMKVFHAQMPVLTRADVKYLLDRMAAEWREHELQAQLDAAKQELEGGEK